jgi:hypothetical protein
MISALLLLVVMLGSSVGVAGQTKNRFGARTLQTTSTTTVTLPLTQRQPITETATGLIQWMPSL